MDKASNVDSDSPSFPWLRDLLQSLKPSFIEAFAISFFTNLLALAVPLFTLQVYDRVVGHNATNTLFALVTGVMIAIAFDFFLRQTRSRLLQHVALKIDASLGRKLYRKFTSLPLQTLESKPTSFWQSLFRDIDTVRTVFSGPSAILVADLPFALLFIMVIAVIATPIAWLLLLIVPGFVLLTYYATKVNNVSTASEKRKQLTRDGLISELLAGRTTVKALMIDKAIEPEFDRIHAESTQESFDRGKYTDNFIALGQSVSTLSIALMVTFGALAIIERDMTIGALIATTMLTGRIIAPLNQLISSWRGFAACRQAVRHLDMVFGFESEREVAGLAREKPKGLLEVQGVTFGYKKDAPALIQELNFVLKPGQMVGLVGRNGCGKTTLIKLLQGLYTPDKGRIMLDGGDLNQFTRDELANWIGYVPQECFLFAGTIKENIAKAYPEARDEDILAASKLAGADQFIIDLPDGYNTQIGEDGSRLSGGQRQRLAIARALLRQPPVLLFDEVTSNLDNQTEVMLRNHLAQLAQLHTILLATHSVLLLKACKNILVMDKGRITIGGPTEEVLPKIMGKDISPPASGGKPQGGAA